MSTSAIVPCRPVLYIAVNKAIAALRAPLESKRSFATVGRSCGTVDMISLLIATPSSARERPECIRAFGSVSTPHCSVREARITRVPTALAARRRVPPLSIIEHDVGLQPVVVALVARVGAALVQEIAQPEHESIAQTVVEVDDVALAVRAAAREIGVRERA